MAAVAVTGQYRRGKTALFLFACFWAGAAPHLLEPTRSFLPAITLVCLLGGYGLRTVLHGINKSSLKPTNSSIDDFAYY